MMWLLLFIPINIVCSVLCYGLSFAYWQRKYYMISDKEYQSDVKFSLMVASFGLIFGLPVLLITFCLSSFGKYGLKFKK